MNKILSEVIRAIQERKEEGKGLYIAIDGRCASGKTTLAEKLKEHLGCNVFHMDDFFLRPDQRTKERMKAPGSNVDYERFEKEVLVPLTAGKSFIYQPYDCHTQNFKRKVVVQPSEICIVEGAYACHPKLWSYYDLHIFLSVDPSIQRQRILKRNGSLQLAVFEERWIPLEEAYFSAFHVAEHCELKYCSTEA